MNRKKFNELISQKVLILDGATGTELQKRGMPSGVCPEKWVIENAEVLKNIQKQYVDAGSKIILTCTFGANRSKLEEFGLGDRVHEFNTKLARLSKGMNCFVAGDIASTGRFIKPLGDMDFEECVEIYKEQVNALLEGGVDLFFIETMLDILEARAALIAVKESCDLPVIVSMTFDNNMRTLTGSDPATALITLQSLGADAVGCNCSTGPQHMIEIIKAMKPYAKVPLMAKPNAGLPKLVGNSTVFDMDSEEFGFYAGKLAEAGANLIGGCCGTSPEYIKKISDICGQINPIPVSPKPFSAVTSSTQTVFFGNNHPITIVGERINPTGKKKLQEELRAGLLGEVRRFADEQVEKGAKILDVNAGMPGIDEKKTMVDIVEYLSSVCRVPLCIDSSSPEVIEAALRVYPGRALINSVSLEQKKIDKLLPIASKYGAMFILLPLSDNGVPEKAEERQQIVEEIFRKAAGWGYRKEDIVIDGLVMTVSSNQEAAIETLKLIRWSTYEFGCNTIIGLSNVSFGLPERSWVNTAFFAMAAACGLTMAIANPDSEILMNIKMACDVLTSKDLHSRNYIDFFSSRYIEGQALKTDNNKPGTPGRKNIEHAVSSDIKSIIYNDILKGERDIIREHILTAINQGNKPQDIVDGVLIPAITEVGKLYDEKKYYLPQLIQSAEAMKQGFSAVEPFLVSNESGTDDEANHDKGIVNNKGIIVIATVKGDIHDIGKNIVALMLRNYGFTVYDLGKDVSAERIVCEARRVKADIIALSALMTTTMIEMKEVINVARREGLACKFMIGGAVVSAEYAKEIGADGYSKDAYDAVKLAKRLVLD